MEPSSIIETEDAFGFIPVPGGLTPSAARDHGFTQNIPVVGTKAIRESFDPVCLQQAVTARCSPGVSELILNPDAHVGYGAPIGCVLVSPSHIYPGPVGVDIKCSMSLLQLDLPGERIANRSAVPLSELSRDGFRPVLVRGSDRSLSRARFLGLMESQRWSTGQLKRCVPHWEYRLTGQLAVRMHRIPVTMARCLPLSNESLGC